MLLFICTMKLVALLFTNQKTQKRKTIADYQREKLVTFGRQQFQKMKELGIGMPVNLA